MKPSQLEFGAIPFDKIENKNIRTGLIQGIRMVEKRIEAIKKDPNPPTFENTIEALEFVFEPLDLVQSVFSHYLAVKSSPTLEKVARKLTPFLTQLGNKVTLDSTVFSKINDVYQHREKLNLSLEQKKLLENAYKAMVRNGAKLNEKEKTRLGKIDEKLSLLSNKFKEHSMAELSAYVHFVTDQAELKGIPEAAIKAAAGKAAELEKPSQWAFTLKAPSLFPVLKFAESEALRQTLWEANSSKSTSGKNDNRPVLLEIAKLKEERAQLLGYKTHAHYTLEERMAKNPETLEKFVTRLAQVYRPAALKELDELKKFAGKENLNPWDLSFYSEKLQNDRYGFSSEELRPYFSLENVIKGAFFAAHKMYGVQFKPRTDIPTWDETVRAFEVTDKDGKFLSLFYLDPYPRDSKRSGAWMNSMQSGGLFEGQLRRPHVVNVGNLTPPVDGEPALLDLNEVTTIFHELGHGLHGMLTQTRYASLSSPNVTWDFVELPSQLNENWAIEPEVLDQYAYHYKTGKRIPAELVTKVRQAQNFQAGMKGLTQLLYINTDLAWHAKDLNEVKSSEDVQAWEEKWTDAYRVLDRGPKAMISPSFSHIFAGGYSAGYYSYKWADVLAADAFSVFQKEGIFNPDTAHRFKTEILEKGGTEDAADLYRRFKGADPDPDALLRREGLLP